MPIEVGLWRVTSTEAEAIQFSAMDTEQRLEDLLAKDISILDQNLILIGRQVPTSYGKFIDLLAVPALNHYPHHRLSP